MGIFPSLVSGASVGAVPGVGLGLEAAGLAGSAVSGIGQYQDQQGIFKAQQNIAQDEMRKNEINFKTSMLALHRNQLQETRNAQVARANALATGVSQGAQFGSGVAGGLAQITDQSSLNLLGLNQAKVSATQSYALTQDEANQQKAITGYQSNASMWAGLGSISGGAGSLGKDLISASTNPSGAQQTQY